jgi:hypothetical protein
VDVIMISLVDVLQSYTVVRLVSDKFIQSLLKSNHFDSEALDYPLGRYHYDIFEHRQAFNIALLEQEKVVGMAQFLIVDTMIDGAKHRVLLLNNLIYFKTFGVFGRRQWRRLFVWLSKHLNEVEEFKACYKLVVFFNYEDNNSNDFKIYDYRLTTEQINQYKVLNILTSSKVKRKESLIEIRKAEVGDLSEILCFLSREKNLRQFGVDNQAIKNNLRTAVAQGRFYILMMKGCVVSIIMTNSSVISQAKLEKVNPKFKVIKCQNMTDDYYGEINVLTLSVVVLSLSLPIGLRRQVFFDAIDYFLNNELYRDVSMISLTMPNDLTIEKSSLEYVSVETRLELLSFRDDEKEAASIETATGEL